MLPFGPSFIRILAMLFVCLAFGSAPHYPEKIKGLAIVGPPKALAYNYIAPIKAVNAGHICIMPYAYGPTEDGGIFFNGISWQWWGESKEGVRELAKNSQANGLKVLLKPHIWMMDGQFTGNYDPGSEAGWNALERSYETYIMEYAWLAQELHVEMFCIGTELHQFVESRPEFWLGLISKVRSVYHGQLTYAGNWDSFNGIPFWNELDLIGLDAYFPLSNKRTPEVQALKKGWSSHFEQIKQLYHRTGKPIAFLEYGYRSMDHATKAPWVSGHHQKVNLEAQRNAYLALYELFWDQPWFLGGYAWKWHLDHEHAGGPANSHFTPQNKPAEQVIRERYAS